MPLAREPWASNAWRASLKSWKQSKCWSTLHLPALPAERAFLRGEVVSGAHWVNTRFEGDQLILTGMVASLDGKRLIDQASGDDAEAIGVSLANTLKARVPARS